ncbi:MAG TPA: GTPase [Thermoplasmata archaeon]|nr:GTPase [Thermoplasmata archaeon]
MKPNISIFFIGIAGSGKSTLTAAFSNWLSLNGVDAVLVNLDPGATNLDYTPDVNIREWVRLEDVMDDYNLGPNGAQIVSADLLSLHIQEVLDIVNEFECDYIIWDTPGQIELFVYRESSTFLLNQFDKNRTLVGFLFEPSLAKSPKGYISQIMLSASVQFRFNTPIVHILSKSDLLSEEEKKRIWNWKDSQELYTSLLEIEPEMSAQLSFEFFKVMETMDMFHPLIQISSHTQKGFDLLFAQIQQIFMGGEVPDDSFYSQPS